MHLPTADEVEHPLAVERSLTGQGFFEVNSWDVSRPKHTREFTMDAYETLCHTRWDCKYHVVFIPKYRRKALFGKLRRHLGPLFRELAEHKESKVEEGHLMPDHVHMLLCASDRKLENA